MINSPLEKSLNFLYNFHTKTLHIYDLFNDNYTHITLCFAILQLHISTTLSLTTYVVRFRTLSAFISVTFSLKTSHVIAVMHRLSDNCSSHC